MMSISTAIRRMVRGRGDEASSALNALAARFPDADAATLARIADCSRFTMTSPERLFALMNAVQYVLDQRIPGDIVECGVWKGGSMMAAAKTLLANNCSDRKLWLFDTFEGMPPADEVDRDLTGSAASDLLAQQDPAASVVWAIAGLDEVARNLESTQYPREQVEYVKGKVEDTIPQSVPESIAILRLDTDWYASTKHELDHLFPRLVSGGVLIIDDYGHWQGARQAVDEYIAEHSVRLHLCRIDYTGRIAVKQ